MNKQDNPKIYRCNVCDFVSKWRKAPFIRHMKDEHDVEL
jgi:uncharacterized C2H2 Zn-finger protein